MKTRPRSDRRMIVRLIAAVILVGLLYVAWDQATYNFGTVQPGRIYRSGQMPATALARTIREYRIKTVLNLRGPNPELSWYPAGAGCDSCRRRDADRHRDVVLRLDVARPASHADRDPRYGRISDLDPLRVGIGAHRTGLGVRRAACPGSTLDDARAQFSLGYSVRAGQRRQESWPSISISTRTGCRPRDLQHSSRTFRRWVNEDSSRAFPIASSGRTIPYPCGRSPDRARIQTPLRPIANRHANEFEAAQAKPIARAIKHRRRICRWNSHEMTIRVRYAETDRMGLLHHANYFVYFEMATDRDAPRQRGISYREIEDSRPFPCDHRHRLQVQAARVLRRPAHDPDHGRAGHPRQDRASVRGLAGRRATGRGPFDAGVRRPRREAAGLPEILS